MRAAISWVLPVILEFRSRRNISLLQPAAVATTTVMWSAIINHQIHCNGPDQSDRLTGPEPTLHATVNFKNKATKGVRASATTEAGRLSAEQRRQRRLLYNPRRHELLTTTAHLPRSGCFRKAYATILSSEPAQILLVGFP